MLIVWYLGQKLHMQVFEDKFPSHIFPKINVQWNLESF